MKIKAPISHHTHEFGPFYQSDAKLLILGSFPSVKSREESFYYAHPQNRFWKVMAACLDEEVPLTIKQKQECLRKHHIALWDVIDECDIQGSSDATIKNIIYTPVAELVKKTNIQCILLNGKTAAKFYHRHITEEIVPTITLPSTSPANAQYRLDDLIKEWKVFVKDV